MIGQQRKFIRSCKKFEFNVSEFTLMELEQGESSGIGNPGLLALEKDSSRHLKALFEKVAAGKYCESQESLTNARESRFSPKIFLPELDMKNVEMYLYNLFTLQNITGLFSGELNGQFLRLPKIFHEENYDDSRFHFIGKFVDGEWKLPPYLLFKITGENMRHVESLLFRLSFSSEYVVGPRGVGKSLTFYFIACLLMGAHWNYNRSLRCGTSEERALWKKVRIVEILGRFPIYLANSPEEIHTFYEMKIFCDSFFPHKIGEKEYFERKPVIRDIGTQSSEQEISQFIQTLSNDGKKFVLIVDEVDSMMKIIGKPVVDQFLGNEEKSNRKIRRAI